MLTTQLQARPRALPSTAQLRTAMAISRSVLQTRTFCLRRRPNDWLSHLDPLYHRFTRYRTLKTRAKLLATLKRRSKFDWDVETRPFFTPRQLRFASHWGYHPRHGRWQLYDENGEPEKAKRKDEQDIERDIDEFELSKKEKAWKDQVDAIKKRLEQDPYEVLFGKRFEPFWSPLVPSWMRDEMGVGWGKLKSQKAAGEAKSSTEPVKKIVASKQTEPELTKQVPVQPKPETPAVNPEALKPKPDPTPATSSPASITPKTYSTYSSTSWDSWTQKTRRTTWDSISGKTRRFEYDPISNRMVQMESPALPDAPMASKPREVDQPAITGKKAESSSRIEAPETQSTALKAAEPQAVEIPVKKSTDIRTSIPVPSTSIEPVKSRPLDMATLINSPPTSVPKPAVATVAAPTTTLAQSTKPARPSILSKLPPNDIDFLTAEDVRARMGKSKHSPSTTPEERVTMERSFSDHSKAVDTEIEALLKERKSPITPKAVEADQTRHDTTQLVEAIATLKKQRAMLDIRERNAFHIKSLTREYREIDAKVADYLRILHSASKTDENPKQPEAKTVAARSHVAGKEAPFQTALERTASKPAKRPGEGRPLQPSVERMASKPALRPGDLDDAAAHEASEALPAAAGVPTDWTNQANLLQADRVRRTASKRPYPMSRWIDDITAKKAEHDRKMEANKAVPSAANTAEAAKKQKAQELLDAEVHQLNMKMQAHEGKWQHHMKAASMQANLKEARQERKQRMEEAKNNVPAQGEGDFSPMITKFADSGKWYKQPLTGPSKQELEQATQKAKDRELVQEVRAIYEKEYGVIDAEHRQPDASKTEQTPATAIQNKQPDSSSTQTKSFPEVKDKIRTKVACTEKSDNLEAQIAAQEKEAHEAQNLMQPDNAANLKRIIAQNLRREELSRGEGEAVEAEISGLEQELAQLSVAQLRQEHQPTLERKVIEADIASMRRELALLRQQDPGAEHVLQEVRSLAAHLKSVKAAIEETVTPVSGRTAIQWEEPPLYMVLAYDSGNDILSTATTTSNFTGSETPISISTALSQLYQPSRFVSHFAALQKEGYQVIHGTKDLLVFKKVKAGNVKPAVASPTNDPTVNAAAAEPTSDMDILDGVANPVVGTKPITSDTDVPTGNFASPTGFVNHDSPFSPKEGAFAKDEEAFHEAQSWAQNWRERQKEWARLKELDVAPDVPTVASKKHATDTANSDDWTIAHYPKVRREEHVFTGTRRKWSSARQERREQRHRERETRREEAAKRRGGTGNAVKWMAIGGGTFGAAAYLIGSAAEKSRTESEYRYSRDDRRRPER